MAKQVLKSIAIEHLRGAVTPFELTFEKGKTLTIVYGENGTGKSTLVDALDLLGNGTVGSLATRGLGQTRKYWPSVGKGFSDVKVLLNTAAGQCGVSLGKNNVAVSNESLRPQIKVLRRSQILQLVEAKAAERYKAISQFIDVSGVETSENTLRSLIRSKEADFNSATTRVTENQEAIGNFWDKAGRPGADALTWAKQESEVDPAQYDRRKEAIDDLKRAWDNLASHPQKLKTLKVQAEAVETKKKNVQSALDALKNSAASEYLETIDLLKAAQTHFRSHPDPKQCPLCESEEKVSGLVAEVDRRLQSQGLHDKLENAKKTASTSETSAQQAQQRFDDARNNAREDVNKFKKLCNNEKILTDLNFPERPVPSSSAGLEAWINANQSKRDEWNVASDACTSRKQTISTMKTLLAPLAENRAQAKQLGALLPHLKRMLEKVESERKRFTDAILTAISTRVGELYEAMHPGEGRNKIALELNAARRASLDISTDFGGGGEVPPQAYFSDSHLDTLGLCIFLALAERESPENKLLVLDDVLGSVDEPHVERVINTIYEVTKAFQHTVITTHYRPWREKFRWGILKPGQGCHFVEFGEWSPSRGISRNGGVIPEIARLKTLLAEATPDVQSIAGKAGVILEALLDFLTLKYACAVPRKPGNTYVLGDFLGAVNGKLLTALKVEVIDQGNVVDIVELKPLIDEIKSIAQARNVLGAHFNTNSFDLNPAEGVRFGKQVEKLCDALVCPEHGRPLKDTGSHWRNSGDTRRLHPLRKPS